MNKFLIVLFFVLNTSDVFSAEFYLNNQKLTSAIHEVTYSSSSYNIRLVTEKFPEKYERKVPSKYHINNFYGSHIYLSKNAYYETSKISLKIPNCNEIHELKNKLLKARTYLPFKAYCKEQNFVIGYWSGGNCHKCEIFVEFKVKDGKFVSPDIISYRKVKELY